MNRGTIKFKDEGALALFLAEFLPKSTAVFFVDMVPGGYLMTFTGAN